MPANNDIEAQVQHAREILSSDDLAPICEMVIWRDDLDGIPAYVAANSIGTVRFERHDDDRAHRFEVVEVEGENFLDKQDQGAFSPVEDERSSLFPTASENHYPNAFESIAQIFDDPNAPDMAAVHTAAHNWEDEGGHRGEHGSLDVIQARAPFVAAGRGIAALGEVDRGIRLVDIAPTILSALGAPTLDNGRSAAGAETGGTYLVRQDGIAAEELINPDDRPERVITFLLDGCNNNVLHDMAARGELPNIARLMEMGTTYSQGAASSFPTVTLANHTAIATGTHPGHHNVLHNSFWHRTDKKRIDTNHPATWHLWSQWVSSDVETIHDAVHRAFPGSFTASIDEPADGGADYSTFGMFRKGRGTGFPESPADLPHASEQFVRPYKDYEWSTAVDHMALDQATGIWSGHFRGDDYPLPKFMWVNFTLTDSAMHRGGPHSDVSEASLRDTDGRIGEIVASIEKAGAYDETAFFLFADHGMEESNPAITGNWGTSLKDEGISFRDEGYGFIYIGVED